jgi:hypothetical protein
MKKKPIYVEIEMHTTIDEVWQHTQNPKLHEQWDLRFSSITYNEKLHDNDEQTFTYSTKLMPGLVVSGWGKSKGTHEKESGVKTSSLHFGTPQLISPIKEGRGYWQYKPKAEGLTFLTQYDYDVRFGFFGRLFDQLFRPMIGWATALSFDVLARWLETGERPITQYRRFFSYYLSIILFIFIWFYQGLVPKLLHQHPLEIAMLSKLSMLSKEQATQGVIWVGVGEIIVALLFFSRKLQPLLLKAQIMLFPLLTVGAMIAAPHVATDPFNVVTLNVMLFILSIIALQLRVNLPTATSCIRKKRDLK